MEDSSVSSSVTPVAGRTDSLGKNKLLPAKRPAPNYFPIFDTVCGSYFWDYVVGKPSLGRNGFLGVKRNYLAGSGDSRNCAAEYVVQ